MEFKILQKKTMENVEFKNVWKVKSFVKIIKIYERNDERD